jgi:hypothetical protein
LWHPVNRNTHIKRQTAEKAKQTIPQTTDYKDCRTKKHFELLNNTLAIGKKTHLRKLVLGRVGFGLWGLEILFEGEKGRACKN